MSKLPLHKRIDYHSVVVVLVIVGTVAGAYFGYKVLSKPNDAFSSNNGTGDIPAEEIFIPEDDDYSDPAEGFVGSESENINTLEPATQDGY